MNKNVIFYQRLSKEHQPVRENPKAAAKNDSFFL